MWMQTYTPKLYPFYTYLLIYNLISQRIKVINMRKIIFNIYLIKCVLIGPNSLL